jgi:hypothetical protein
MMMPGRNTEYHWSRFGAQGSVKDDEVYGKGNYLNLEAREYDTRTLRPSSIDPLFKKFPHESPYSYAGNSFIGTIDKRGETKTVFHIIINEQTGHVSIKKETSGGLMAQKRQHYETGSSHYDWYDYTQTKVTYTNNKGVTSTAISDPNRVSDQVRTQTEFGFETYAQLKASDGVFRAVKDNRMFDGFIQHAEGADASGNAYSPNAGPGSQMVDAGAILRLMEAFGNISGDAPVSLTDKLKYAMGGTKIIDGTVKHLESKVGKKTGVSDKDTVCDGCGNSIGSGTHGMPKTVVNSAGDTVEKLDK